MEPLRPGWLSSAEEAGIRPAVSLSFQVRALHSPSSPLQWTLSVNHRMMLCLCSAASRKPARQRRTTDRHDSAKSRLEKVPLSICRTPEKLRKRHIKYDQRRGKKGPVSPPEERRLMMNEPRGRGGNVISPRGERAKVFPHQVNDGDFIKYKCTSDGCRDESNLCTAAISPCFPTQHLEDG